MTSRVMVIVHELICHPDQVGLTQGDDVVQIFPPHRPNDALGKSILPRRSQEGQHLGDALPRMHRATVSPKIESLSWIRNLGAVSNGKASRSCQTIHSALGRAVTLNWTIRRRAWCKMTKTYNTRPVIVGTVKKSITAVQSMWLRMNTRQVEDRGPLSRSRPRYFEIVARATLCPSMAGSACIRGVPQRGFSAAVRLMSARRSTRISGRPPRDFHGQNNLNPARCQPTTVADLTITRHSRHRRSTCRAPDPDQPVPPHQPRPLDRVLQYGQLVTQQGVLRRESRMGSERSPNESKQHDHPLNVPDRSMQTTPRSHGLPRPTPSFRRGRVLLASRSLLSLSTRDPIEIQSNGLFVELSSLW